ncbi:hypothetical protein DUI87_20559 [Hirundo rustica rustica]|uniref:Integrase catalytic domain-containing protein n=1 Tax=Hirundo rustica rustica TaxID=333673 RepID=A0A3M0JQU7_HIRRU|nr:hypothetical protein DUI87_20559 [Hirundo rustica rustica]
MLPSSPDFGHFFCFAEVPGREDWAELILVEEKDGCKAVNSAERDFVPSCVAVIDPLDRDSFTGLDCKYIIIRDTKYTPLKIEISPEVITSDPEGLILMARCLHLPYFLPKGQAIPVPTKLLVVNSAPGIYWAEVVGEDKPIIGCGIHRGFELQQEKVQQTPSWRFLGLEIASRTTRPQKAIKDNPRTLVDFHQLCGSLNWGGGSSPDEVVLLISQKGLVALVLWESSGRLKYVHVSVNTFSGAVYASAHREEATDAQKHLIQDSSVLSILKVIKTNNRPKYASKVFGEFLQQWGTEHKKGIPCSPTGQAGFERTKESCNSKKETDTTNEIVQSIFYS